MPNSKKPMTIIRSQLLEYIALLNDELSTRKLAGLTYLEGWAVQELEFDEHGLSTSVSLCYCGDFVGCIPLLYSYSECSLEIALVRIDLVISACRRYASFFQRHKAD